jgi:hypothetical protein
MMNVMRNIVLFCLFLGAALTGYAGVDSLSYDIILFNNKVGKMLITREVMANDVEVYKLITTSKAKILWIDKTNDSKYELVFKAGKLISSVFKEIENGAVKRWNNITWDGAKYLVDSYNGKRSFKDIPTYSTISAYFQGFRKVDHIFYESEADFAVVEYPEPNTLSFKTSDGHKSIYHYLNNRIINMEFRIPMATVYMVLSK